MSNRPKFNPWASRPIVSPPVSVVIAFADGSELDLTFRKLDRALQMKAATAAQEMVVKYLEGDDETDPVPFPPSLTGETIEPTPELFQMAAVYWVSQTNPANGLKTIEDWAMVLKVADESALKQIDALLKQARRAAKDGPFATNRAASTPSCE